MLSKSTKSRIIGVTILVGVLAFNIKLIEVRSQVLAKTEVPDYLSAQPIVTSGFIGPTAPQLLEIGVITDEETIKTSPKVQEPTPESTPTPPAAEIEEEVQEPATYLEMSEEDVKELATLVYLESGSESYECQKAIASVVIHRMQNGNLTLQEVIYAKNQFSPAYLIAESKPSESTMQAVREVLQDGPTIPNYVTFFRADYYHNWSDLIIPYCVIDHTYFSADTRLME